MPYLKKLIQNAFKHQGLVLICLSLTLCSIQSWAQSNTTLRGVVTSSSGPLSDAQVGIKGDAFTVFTDAQGEFALSVADEFPLVLTFSHQDFQSTHVVVDANSYIEASMVAGASTVDPIQVVKVFGKVVDDNDQPLRNASVDAACWCHYR